METRTNSETVELISTKLKSLFSDEDLRQFSLKAQLQLDPEIADVELAHALALLRELAIESKEVRTILSVISTVYAESQE